MKYFVLLLLVLASCSENRLGPNSSSTKKISQIDSNKVVNYWRKAQYRGMYSNEYQKYLDSILLIVPDSAYFWQQKAMPLYKSRKYAVGKPFLEKAAKLNPAKYLDYSAFMKCLFSKEHQESITEFMEVKKRYGDSYVMDHTYNFYLGLNYLQLNNFEKAKEFLEKSKEQQIADFPKRKPEHAVHHLDWFYMGLAEYELQNFDKAIENLDMSLKVYKDFGDALFFKSICLTELNRELEAQAVRKRAYENAKNTINEDQVFYEVYPYQVFNKLSPMSRSK
ncbi:hypothetical protein GH721_18650 [Kriegella sp. EG-1]|nr:hypothetical protein [Flavobacteriaceae bacterium EG-1]